MSALKQAVVASLSDYPSAKRVLIAYSGGLDSHVLLHVCSTIDALKSKLHAVYIHHGLLAEADAWAEHCQQTAMNLGVSCQIIHVNAQAKSGESPEEAARNARYAALKTLLGPGDLILLAQHQEDQMETVLLQLFRGAGLRGLSGMPSHSAFGLGIMLRPFFIYFKTGFNRLCQHTVIMLDRRP
ncbi:tRNA lysidine(34) synthetase TilS [Methylocucumis oryzae]|uniref:tRNA lysidine(34) synthetase TilS n=1 Tax=Methylocucumis oryzae TaxID=1632867 RepID=UPI000695F3DB|nr:tRNA lysidine(34) synthetase TilS [Methylocucumis oryzae]